ncbi:MAG: anthrax toxin lethal factor-related metalloendopeptidase [Acidiferrobacterales bacterium]
MSESWNLALCGDRECFLLNKTRTLVRMSKRVRVELPKLLVEMEEHRVPFQYTEGLNEVYFTLLRDNTCGDYINDKIRLSCDSVSQELMGQTLVHELAHHVDEQEDISERDEIKAEKKARAQYMEDKYCKKNAGEYVAVGFEVYYFGSPEEKKKMEIHNPVLFKTIKGIHRKYQAR